MVCLKSTLEEGNFVCQNLLSTEMSKLVKFLQLGMKRLEKVCQLDHSPSKQLSSLDQILKLDFGVLLGDSNFKLGSPEST